MKILNLVYPDKSDIKYEISKFPDGQQQVAILNYKPDIKGYLSRGLLTDVPVYDLSVKIKSRLNNFKDLEIIACAVASLRELGVGEIHLEVPYVMGARSDRKFSEGSNNYLKDVICPFINLLGCNSVTVLDPHSDCLEMGIKGFRKVSNVDLIRWVKDQMNVGWNEFCANSILVSPDAGASKKIYKLSSELNLTCPIITCSKDRDENGKLTKCVIPWSKPADYYTHKDFIIIDDICDGGQTFINIAKAIDDHIKSQHSPYEKLYLIVTHGIFSKGFQELSKYFDGIYCTNSYSDLMAISFESNENGNHKINVEKLVKQLNIF